MTGEEYLKKWHDAMQRWLDHHPLKVGAEEVSQPVQAAGPGMDMDAERRIARQARLRAWLGG